MWLVVDTNYTNLLGLKESWPKKPYMFDIFDTNTDIEAHPERRKSLQERREGRAVVGVVVAASESAVQSP